MANLSKFTSLEELFLSNNNLHNVDFLKDLENIKTIDLHHNKIETLKPIIKLIKKIGISHSKWKIGTINIENNPLDEVLLNIANENDNEEKKQQLNFYFERLGFGGTKKINRTKIIFLGNTKAGKTTISDILTGENKANGGSTHGVNFINYTIPETDIIIKGYDFGGQDYYHNLYHTFLDNSSLKLLVWGNGQENECYLNNDNEILFPLRYWLTLNNKKIKSIYEKEVTINDIIENHVFTEHNENENLESEINAEQFNELFEFIKLDRSVVTKRIKDFPYNSQNIFHYYLLQNIKEGEEKKYLNQKELKSKYPFITDFKDFCFFNEKDRIRDWIFNVAKENSIENEIQLIDHNVKKAFESDYNQNKVVLTFDDIKSLKIDKLNLIDDGNLDALLKGLHSIIGCYYFNKNENFIENKIIVNIEVFTDWICKILNIENLLKTKDGYFTIEDAKEWLIDDNIALLNINFIIEFMLCEKLIFKMKGTSNRYFAPSYLPIIKSKTEKLFLKTFDKPFIKYKYESYFHTSILSEIISTFFDKLVLNDSDNKKWQYILWKNKVILFDDVSDNQEELILVEFHLPESIEDKIDIPFISISKYNSNSNNDFVGKIMLHIESESENWSKELLSPNGNYIPYDVIINEINNPDGKISNIFTYNNQIYKKSDFKLFLSAELQKNYPMKKVFISYSHTDINAMKELTKFLSGLERNGKIEKWTDVQLQSGVVVKNEIIKKLEEADIVILLISQNFISSDFIFDNELPIAMNKKLKGKGAIIPVYLSESTIFDLELNVTDVNGSNLKMGNYYFIPQDENNNLKPIEEWRFTANAWKKVYDEVTKLL